MGSENPFELGDGQWLCEAVLWCHWEYQGRLCAVAPCEFVTLDSSRFQTVMSRRPHVVGACREYAKTFTQRLNRDSEILTDIGLQFDEIQELAHLAFEHVDENEAPSTNVQLTKMWRSWSPPQFVNEAMKNLHVLTRKCNTL